MSRNNKFPRDRSKSWTWRVKEQQPTADSAAAAADALPGSEPGAHLPVTAPPGARVVVPETALDDNDEQEPPPPPPGKPATPRAQEFLPPMAGEEVEGTERALSPAAPTSTKTRVLSPAKGRTPMCSWVLSPTKGRTPSRPQSAAGPPTSQSQ